MGFKQPQHVHQWWGFLGPQDPRETAGGQRPSSSKEQERIIGISGKKQLHLQCFSSSNPTEKLLELCYPTQSFDHFWSHSRSSGVYEQGFHYPSAPAPSGVFAILTSATLKATSRYLGTLTASLGLLALPESLEITPSTSFSALISWGHNQGPLSAGWDKWWMHTCCTKQHPPSGKALCPLKQTYAPLLLS